MPYGDVPFGTHLAMGCNSLHKSEASVTFQCLGPHSVLCLMCSDLHASECS